MKHCFTLILLFFSFLSFAQQKNRAVIIDTANYQVPVKEIAYKSSLSFVENKNQWDKSILYRADLPAGYLFVKENSIQYSFYDYAAIRINHGMKEIASKAPTSVDVVNAHSVEVSFVNANSSDIKKLNAQEQRIEKRNYFLGNEPSKWASEVSSYAAMYYSQLYEGIDLKLYETNNSFKYEYMLAPGADAGKILMQYQGAESLQIVRGDLLIRTSLNTITEKKPYSYQIIRGKKVEVPSRFVLKGNLLSFDFPKGYNKNYALVIDPILIFSTYSGATADNWGSTATFDEAGNLYSGGIVRDLGVGFPTTVGAFQTSFRGINDVGILKFNPSGTALIYATYLGGTDSEFPHSLIVNSNNELVIFGTTSSLNFPTTASAYSRNFNGGANITVISGVGYSNGSDIFIAKLSANGSELLASTYLGGSGNDGINTTTITALRNYGDQFRGELILDDNDFIYIASTTNSSNFPLQNAYQSTLSGTQDAVTVKLQPDLSGLVWSTFLGGTGVEAAYSVKLSVNQDVFVCGLSTSTNFPTQLGALHPTALGSDDAFIAKFDNTGILSKATYLGTNNADQAFFLDLDTDGSVHVVGQTFGVYPTTPGVYQNAGSGQFIHKLNGDLSQTIFSTIIGTGKGRPDISPTAFLVNDCGNIYLTGWGSNVGSGTTVLGTTNLPITADAYSKTTDGNDFYITILEKDAKSLLYATYFGGSTSNDHVDGGTCRFDKKGIIYHAACASCGNSTADFPTTANAFSRVDRSINCNNGAFKFDIDALIADFDILDSTFKVEINKGCVPIKVNFIYQGAGAVTYTWDIAGLATFQNMATVPFTFNQTGTYLIKLTVKNCLGAEVSINKSIQISELKLEVSDTKNICLGEFVQLDAIPNDADRYLWSPANGLNNVNIPNPIASPNRSTTYTVKVIKGGCELKNTVRVNVFPEIKADFETELSGECGKGTVLNLTNLSEGANGFVWIISNGDSLIGENPSPYIFPSGGGDFDITLRAFNEECEVLTTKSIFIENNASDIPNAITPGNDDKNETFVLPNRENYKIEIYNRWGNLVFKSNNYQNDWGKDARSGLYYYLLTSPTGVVCKGWVQVLR